jgi:hypothetical protein
MLAALLAAARPIPSPVLAAPPAVKHSVAASPSQPHCS